jgi:hypothetical protein
MALKIRSDADEEAHTLLKFLTALGLTLLLLLAACGGDDDDDAGDDAPNDATATESTDDAGDGDEATDAPDDRGDDDDSGNDEGGDDDNGGDDDDGGSADALACELLTPGELATVVDETWGEGDDTGTTPEASKCTWENELGTSAIYLEGQTEGGEAWWDIIHDPNDNFDEGESVDGLGDKALWQDGLSVLDVLDGDKYISIQVVVFSQEIDDLAAATELAEMVLARI